MLITIFSHDVLRMCKQTPTDSSPILSALCGTKLLRIPNYSNILALHKLNLFLRFASRCLYTMFSDFTPFTNVTFNDVKVVSLADLDARIQSSFQKLVIRDVRSGSRRNNMEMLSARRFNLLRSRFSDHC